MIKVEGISKKFGDFEALSEVTCAIPDGKIYGLVGSNGAGKSTLLRVMAGIYKPDKGTVSYDGEPVWDNVAVKEKFVFVPDELYFLPGYNMKRMAKFYQIYYPSFSMERFNELTAKLKLDVSKKLAGFSKGMRRQAATVLALSCRPQYYFFDETFDGLDPVMRNVVKTMIYDDICERNVTAVITSHSLRELEDTCDQLALLHKGGLVFENDVESMKTNLVKVQFAMKQSDFTKEMLEEHLGRLCKSFKKEGRICVAIVEKGTKSIEEEFAALQPAILDILPLSLEEVFTYEMEALGYAFDEESEGENHEVTAQ